MLLAPKSYIREIWTLLFWALTPRLQVNPWVASVPILAAPGRAAGLRQALPARWQGQQVPIAPRLLLKIQFFGTIVGINPLQQSFAVALGSQTKPQTQQRVNSCCCCSLPSRCSLLLPGGSWSQQFKFKAGCVHVYTLPARRRRAGAGRRRGGSSGQPATPPAAATPGWLKPPSAGILSSTTTASNSPCPPTPPSSR